jgi:DNA-binding NarL/FixJ family response regulator
MSTNGEAAKTALNGQSSQKQKSGKGVSRAADAGCAPRRADGAQRRSRRRKLLVALIDSRPLIRDALAHRLRIVRRDCDIMLFPTAADFLRKTAVAEEEVDLVVVGARSSEIASGKIVDVVRQLCNASPSERVIIISDRDDADAVAATIEQGARGYIPTSVDLPVAIAALELVLAGGTFAPAATLIRDVYADGDGAATSPAAEPDRHGTRASCDKPSARELSEKPELTMRELEVLACLAKGQSNKMIARELDLREGTVKVHLRHLMRKLNASNRTQLALRADRPAGAEEAPPARGDCSDDPQTDLIAGRSRVPL